MAEPTVTEPSSPAEERAVLAALRALLDAISRRDKAAMREILMPDGGSTHVRDGRVFHMRLRDEPDRWAVGTARLEERIYEPLIRVDENIAMVWVAYDFLVDGEVHHWGTNIVSFLKQGERWLVSGIADNGRSGPRAD
jgi:Putative lumazine-binding